MKVNINKINEFLEKREQEKQKTLVLKKEPIKGKTVSTHIPENLYFALLRLCEKNGTNMATTLKGIIEKNINGE